MTRRKRRSHSPEFKAKVAIAALRGGKALAELAQRLMSRADALAADQMTTPDSGYDFHG